MFNNQKLSPFAKETWFNTFREQNMQTLTPQTDGPIVYWWTRASVSPLAFGLFG
jgi:hypothetical protein